MEVGAKRASDSAGDKVKDRKNDRQQSSALHFQKEERQE